MAAGRAIRLGNDRFQPTGTPVYLENGDILEKSAKMADHASTRTTQSYGRWREEPSPGEVEKLRI